MTMLRLSGRPPVRPMQKTGIHCPPLCYGTLHVNELTESWSTRQSIKQFTIICMLLVHIRISKPLLKTKKITFNINNVQDARSLSPTCSLKALRFGITQGRGATKQKA